MENKLKFTPINNPVQIGFIPWPWLEQIENRSWSTEWFYRVSPTMLMSVDNWMWYITNEEHQNKGFLWAKVDMLSGELSVVVYSIDRCQQADDDFENTQEFLEQVIIDYNESCADYLMELKEKVNWPGVHLIEEPVQPDAVQEPEDN